MTCHSLKCLKNRTILNMSHVKIFAGLLLGHRSCSPNVQKPTLYFGSSFHSKLFIYLFTE